MDQRKKTSSYQTETEIVVSVVMPLIEAPRFMDSPCFIPGEQKDFEGSLVNPCDGRCHGNPSGLYPNPQREDWFIQCGDGVAYGKVRSFDLYYLAFHKCQYRAKMHRRLG